MHNNIMAAGPYTPSTIIIPVVPPTDNSPADPEQTTVETILNMSPEYKAHFESEKKAIHLILTGIGDEIYSTSHKSYAPTSKALLPTRSYATTRHKGKEIAKPITPSSESASEEDNDPEQAQKDKEMQKNLALIAKYFKKIYKPTNNNLRTSSNTRNKNVDTTSRYKNDNQTRQFRNQRTMTVAGARETIAKKSIPLQAEQSDWLADTDEEIDEQELKTHYSYMAKIQEVPTTNSGTDSEPLEQVQYDVGYNVFANEIQHSKQPKSICNTCVVETGDSNVIPDSPDLCDDDIQNDQNDVESDDERVALANLIANLKLDCKSILAKTSRTLGESNSIRDSCLVALQNKKAEFERYEALNDCTVDYKKLEHKLNETLGLLAQKDIDRKEGLKLKAYEISVVKEKHDELVKQSLLTKSHYEGLVQEKTKVITDLKLKEEKDIDKMISLEKQIKFLNEIVCKRNQSIQTIYMLAPKGPTFNGRPTFANLMYLKKAQSEKPYLYEIPNDQSDPVNRLVPDWEETLTLEGESRELVDQAWVKHSKDHFRAPTAHDMEILIKTCLMPLALKTQNDIFVFVHELKQEMHADLKYVESLENEIDELESDKEEFSNMYDILLQECVSNDVMCSYLHSLSDLDAHSELQCLYLHKVKEYECLAQKLLKQTESVSKEVYTELLRSFSKLEKHSISLELALQQCQEQMKNDTVCKEKASNVFQKEREQNLEIQDLKAQLQDKNISISELKKLVEKCKGKSVETKFDKPSVVQQPNAQRIPKPSVLGKPTPFLDSLERKIFSQTKSVPKTNVSERVIHKTTVSRPQLRSTQMKYKVVPNNSQLKNKKTEVEDHPRISSISNKTKSVTACNDSLKSRTSNVNAVCATCGKCVFNSNHDACVSKYLNDMNARTKKPKVVPISTKKPKSQANKSVATPYKKIVASESTTQKSKSYYRMLYEKTSKAWKWWIEQQCPSRYKWVPKTKTKWVPKVRNENVQKRVSFAIDNASRKTNVLKLTNTLGSNLSSIPSSSNSLADCLNHPIHC
ncbi:hypothetical protein Tco_0777630 [Tanacetum coccineum]